MRVGLVIYGSLDTLSGGYLYDRMLVDKLRQRGDEVDIISIRRRPYVLNLLHNLSVGWRQGYDVLLQDELNHPSLILPNRQPHRTPIVSIVHHLRCSERRPRWLNAGYRVVERAYLDTVDGFIFNSLTTRDSVEHVLRRLLPEAVCITATPGGDRLGRCAPEFVARRAREPGPLRLTYLASVTPGKGLDVLLQALTLIPQDEIRLDVVGSVTVAPGFAARMRRLAAALQLPVTFHGALADAKLSALLRASQAMVIPSYYEGFGIAYLEGMACGLPAIGTVAGAISSLIQDGKNGYLVKPGNASELAERIRLLAANRDTLLHLSLGALGSFAGYPSWDVTTERIREYLLSLARAWD